MIQGITDRKFRLRVTALFSMALVLLIANVAFAAWTANGEGTGSATAGEAEDLEIAPVGAGTLFPTVTVDLEVKITNPNLYNVSVDKLVLGADGITSNDTACDNAGHGVTFDDTATTNGPWVVGAESFLDVTIEDALTMSNASDDLCQDKTFTINLELGTGSESTDADPTTP